MIADDLKQGAAALVLPELRQHAAPSIADQVFNELQRCILSLELAPGTKISELEVARHMGVSRQPVRESFKRLAKIDFLVIRPQSSTTVSLISEKAVLQARYIRTALEVQTCRTACEKLDEEKHAILANIIEDQKAAMAANDRDLFHVLDEQFHRQICVLSGVDYVWDLISENKAQMDRVRMLTLNTYSQKIAVQQHLKILNAIAAGHKSKAAQATTEHLAQISVLIDELKAENHRWFKYDNN